MKSQIRETSAEPRKGLKVLGIILVILTIITTLSALGTIVRLSAIETDVATHLGRIIGALIIPTLLGVGAWYSFKKYKS